MAKNKHLVMYKGVSIWRDAQGKLWGTSDNREILESRTYEDDQSQDDFLKKRPDIKFMVDYGHMKIESIDDTPKAPAPAGDIGSTPPVDPKGETGNSTPPADPKSGVTITGR